MSTYDLRESASLTLFLTTAIESLLKHQDRLGKNVTEDAVDLAKIWEEIQVSESHLDILDEADENVCKSFVLQTMTIIFLFQSQLIALD